MTLQAPIAMCSRTLISSLFLGVSLACSSYCEEIEPAEILERIHSRFDSLENLTVETKWTEYRDGRPLAASLQLVCKDHFGRVRVRSLEVGAQSRKKLTDETYNGEITINYTEDPSLNRLGQSHSAATLDNGERYKVAIVNEGLGTDGRGPNVYRNPFYFISQWILKTLSNRLKNGGDFTVAPADTHAADYVIEFQLSPNEDPFETKHSVYVDSTKGWVINRHERKSKSAVLLALTTCEYAQEARGTWVPKSGSWKAWNEPSPLDPADTEWRFEVQEITYNDPDFDESVFDVTLEEGTYVVDNRHDVSYHVGSENAVSADLEALSQKALAAQDDLLKRLEIKPSDISKGGGGFFSVRSLLVLVNIVVVATLLVVFLRRRLHA